LNIKKSSISFTVRSARTLQLNVGLFQHGNGAKKAGFSSYHSIMTLLASFAETDISSDVKSNRFFGQVLALIYNDRSLTRKVIK
jgi:DNA-binding transcriptional regulator GbsR (MarR family)